MYVIYFSQLNFAIISPFSRKLLVLLVKKRDHIVALLDYLYHVLSMLLLGFHERDIVPFFFRLKKDKVMLNEYVTCNLYMYIVCNIKCIFYYYRYNTIQYDNILKYILQ